MKIQQHHNLKAYNTFGIEVFAKSFVEVESEHELLQVIRAFRQERKLILGGGSNILFTQDFDGLVIKISLKGIEVRAEDDNFLWVSAAAGEEWHEFVRWSLARNLGGIENLSLIPGTVGAAVIQNIGAYGVEVKQTVVYVRFIDIASAKYYDILNEDCHFGYRESIFKQALKNRVVITEVIFKLHKDPQVHTDYGDIQKVLSEQYTHLIDVQAVSKAICSIREAKLPNPKEIGNAGSFFKNPEIGQVHFESLKQTFPNIVGYQASADKIKVPAGWLIEQCGWKGKRLDNIGVHSKQALVLVNYGGGLGKDIEALSKQIRDSVAEKFAITLEPEVNIL